MPLRYRKSVKAGPFRLNVSNRGTSWSVRGGGLRYSPARRQRWSSGTPCCLNLLLMFPVLLPARLVQLGWRRLRG